MNHKADYLLVLEGNREYKLSEDEYERFRKKRGTIGRQFPVFKMDNGNEISMNKVLAIEVTNPQFNPEKIEEEEIPCDTVATPEEVIVASSKDALGIKELEAKAVCVHKDVSLYFQNTKKGQRFFPVCDFCGHRGRYIATDKITEDEKATSIEWDETVTTQKVC